MADAALGIVIGLVKFILDKEVELEENDKEAKSLCVTIARLGRSLERSRTLVNKDMCEALEKVLKSCGDYLGEFKKYSMLRQAYRLAWSKDKKQLMEFEKEIQFLLVQIAALGHEQKQENEHFLAAFAALRQEPSDFPTARREIMKVPPDCKNSPGDKDTGQNLLQLAAEKGDAESIYLLLEAEAEVNLASRTHMTALLYALQNGHVEAVKLLINKGHASVDQASGVIDRSPLEYAIRYGHIECLRILMAAGANIEARDCDEQTTLHYAVRAKSHSRAMTELLIQTGRVEINRGDRNNKTPLFLAIETWRAERNRPEGAAVAADCKRCAELLLAAGALPTIGDNINHVCPRPTADTPRDPCMDDLWVCGPDAIERLSLMLSCAHADVNAGDGTGRTLAYRAARHPIESPQSTDGDFSTLEFLVEKHHAVFLSHNSAMLREDEKRQRAIEFGLLAVALIWAAYAYHTRHEAQVCETFYSGLVLPPYLFTFMGTFVFKLIQFLFEECLLADFLLEALCHWRNGAGKKQNVTSAPPTPSPVHAQQRDDDLESSLPPSSKAAAGSSSSSSSINSDERIGGSNSSSPVLWDSRVLYYLFGEDFVHSWRCKKYKMVELAERDTKAADFYHQTPYQFLYLQLLAAYFAIVVAFLNIDVGMLGAIGGWVTYTDLMASIVNSPVIPYCYSLLSMAYLGRRREQLTHLPLAIKAVVAIPILFLLPALITHVLPAVGSYPFLVAPVLPIVWSLLQLCRAILSWLELRPFFQQYHLELATELALRFIFVFGFHVLFDWEAMLWEYSPPVKTADYLAVLGRDLVLRTQSHCFTRQAFSNARGVSSFFSWF